MNKFLVDISKLQYNSKPSYVTLRKYLVDAKDIIIKFNNLAGNKSLSSPQGTAINLSNNTIFTDGQI